MFHGPTIRSLAIKTGHLLPDPSIGDIYEIAYHFGPVQWRVVSITNTLEILVESEGLFPPVVKLSLIEFKSKIYRGDMSLVKSHKTST